MPRDRPITTLCNKTAIGTPIRAGGPCSSTRGVGSDRCREHAEVYLERVTSGADRAGFWALRQAWQL
jgi:hypothetical protein